MGQKRRLPARRITWASLAFGLLNGCAPPAWAHDTWLAARPDTERGERVLALGTGARFPAQQTAIPLELLQRHGCTAPRDPGLRPWPLRWWADAEGATLLRSTRAVPATELLDCQVQMAPLDIRLEPAAAATYLDEVRADAAMRARWVEQRSRGLAWQERFSKHTRLLHGGAAHRGPLVAGARDAAGAMPLDVRIELPHWPLHVGDVLQLQLLRDGQPLPGHAVELRNDLSPIGLWRQTDAEGRFTLPLPLAARWLLRSIDLRPRADAADAWESRFLGLSFEVLAPR